MKYLVGWSIVNGSLHSVSSGALLHLEELIARFKMQYHKAISTTVFQIR